MLFALPIVAFEVVASTKVQEMLSVVNPDGVAVRIIAIVKPLDSRPSNQSLKDFLIRREHLRAVRRRQHLLPTVQQRGHVVDLDYEGHCSSPRSSNGHCRS